MRGNSTSPWWQVRAAEQATDLTDLMRRNVTPQKWELPCAGCSSYLSWLDHRNRSGPGCELVLNESEGGGRNGS